MEDYPTSPSYFYNDERYQDHDDTREEDDSFMTITDNAVTTLIKTASQKVDKKGERKKRAKRRAEEDEQFESIEVKAFKETTTPNNNKEDSLNLLENELLKERLKVAQMRESYKEYNNYSMYELAHASNKTRFNLALPAFAWNYNYSKECYFILTSYEVLWSTMLTTNIKKLHCYEQLRPMDPCHGYIDVEIYRKANKHRNSDELESGIHILAMKEIKFLMIERKYISKESDVDFIISESSNDEKISLHFHVIVEGGRFRNNYHFGSFMRHLVIHLQTKYGIEPSTNPFFFYKPKKEDKKKKQSHSFNQSLLISKNQSPLLSEQSLMLSKDQSKELENTMELEFWGDMSVYTMNRNFRMLYHTKATGDYRPLMPVDVSKTKRNYNYRPTSSREFNKELFFRSILQRTSEGEIQKHKNHFKIFECKDPITGEDPISTNHTSYFRLDKKQEQMMMGSTLKFLNNNKRQKLTTTTIGTTTSKFLNPNSHPIFQKIARRILDYWTNTYDPKTGKVSFLMYNPKKKIAHFSSYSNYCLMNNGRHEGGNHIKFQFCLENRFLFQTCFSSNKCCQHGNENLHSFQLVKSDGGGKDPLFFEIFDFLEAEKKNQPVLQESLSNAKTLLGYIEFMVQQQPPLL